jgi:Photosynthesis system II assembly factor YCF48
MLLVTPMKKKAISPVRIAFLIFSATLIVTAGTASDDKTASDWHAHTLPFRVLNTTSIGPSLWICGTDEAVAVSSDAGEHWQVKHKTTDGALLLNIGFANDKFGYAAGTGGLFLTTEDGGETWVPHSEGKDAILQVSFSDTKHGLIRTFTSLLFTTDGGANWEVVSGGQNSDDIKHFPYTFSLVALDNAHMAVMMKEGSAQYEGQRFLVTGDSGKSWKFVAIPNTTLYSFLRVQGKYWTVGTEVIHKDQPGGGYGVPVALYSSDGEKWDHSSNDLSACKLQMCVGCTTEGCLSANGTISDLFSDKTSYKEFSSNGALTSKWAAAGSAVCFVGNGLQCAEMRPVVKPSSSEGPLPVAVGPGPLGASIGQGPQCIVCNLDRILIDKKAQGPHTIKLVLEIAKNGIVRNAVAEGAPTPEVKSQIEQQAQEWIFEPYLKDGVGVNVKLNTSVHVNIIKPR